MGMTWLHKPSLLSTETLAAWVGAPYPKSPISVEDKLLRIKAPNYGI
ncbi:hypothetical protein LEMLEM_LOCUS4874 [Lemmus lemmus]